MTSIEPTNLEINEWLQEYKNAENKELKMQLKNLIVIACLPLVKKIAHGLARRSTDPIDDLIQVGSVGLIKSIEFFNPKVSENFRVYASYMITGEIRHYLRDKVSMIKAPREIQELAYRIYQITQNLTEELERPPTDAEIAKKLELPVTKINDIIDVERRKQTISLDQIIPSSDDNYQALKDRIIDDKYQEYLHNREDRIMLKEAIEVLDEPLKEAIKLSYFEDLCQREIAEKVGISQMQVSRRLKKGLNQLFEIITRKKQLN